jgi:hypothetical protein
MHMVLLKNVILLENTKLDAPTYLNTPLGFVSELKSYYMNHVL